MGAAKNLKGQLNAIGKGVCFGNESGRHHAARNSRTEREQFCARADESRCHVQFVRDSRPTKWCGGDSLHREPYS
jgi:hypothetical protein